MSTNNVTELTKDIKIGDVICITSYGGAKTWSRYTGITQRYCSHLGKKVPYHGFKDLYYISRYDRHLSGKSNDSYTFST